MPEIKNQFTGGKMNKDLDERLVPKGEYRDAMNIQVSTSEDSEVGTIQNILGNKAGCTYGQSGHGDGSNPILTGSKTVGSVSDESNDTLYWLVAGPEEQSFSSLASGSTTTYKDMIMRTDKETDSNCRPVFVDKWKYCVGVESDGGFNVTDNIILENEDLYSNIFAGMRATGYLPGDPPVVANNFQSTLVKDVGYLNTLPVNYISGIGTTTVAVPGSTSANTSFYVRTFETAGETYSFAPGSTNLDYMSSYFYDGIHNGNTGQFPEPTNLPSNLSHIQLLMRTSTPAGPQQLPSQFAPGNTINGIINQADNAIYGTCTIISVTTANLDPTYGLNYQTYGSTFEQYYIVEVDPGPQAPAVNNKLQNTASINYFPSQVHNQLQIKCKAIRPASTANESIVTNVVNIDSSSSNWLNDIYSILYDTSAGSAVATGNKISINNSIADGVYFPANSCIDPTSVTSINDNSFDIVDCTDLTTPKTPSYAPSGQINSLTFSVIGQGIKSITLNSKVQLQGVGTICFEADRILNFHHDRLITGINIIDDMLFWTDNFYEPKKINIPRSIQGTDYFGDTHTAIVNDGTGVNIGNYQPIREEHITVIRKNPKKSLELELLTGRDDSLKYTGITVVSTLSANSSIISSSNTSVNTDFSALEVEDTVRFTIETDINGGPTNDLQWFVGDVLLLKEYENNLPDSIPLRNFTIRGVITSWNGSIVEIQILNIDTIPSVPSTGFDINYVVDLEDIENILFEDKFPRFSYRYKYADNEYSTFAPFSQVAFLPGGFDYDSATGWNTGMTNNVSSIKLKGFLPTLYQQPIGQDVVEVDILYKEESSPDIYIIDTIAPNDINTSWYQDVYEINSETIKSLLPSNQLLRPFDNVPKKALAQEITGNRIVYANYEQNYDLKVGSSKYKPEFKNILTTWGSNIESVGQKSIKSLRDYKLGVVFTDDYGRETPILIDKSGGFKIEKTDSNKGNRLKVSMQGDPPAEMSYFRFYIKETSTEYYNLPMDRWYAAEDGNIWLAFPSSDRNKVDLDTYLYFKKGSGSQVYKNNTKYKILAIENEAPEFIKTRRIRIGTVKHNATSTANQRVFGETSDELKDAPTVNNPSFTMSYVGGGFGGTSISHLDEITEDLYIQFFNPAGQFSEQYKISEITADRDPANNPPGDPTEYYVTLDTIFKEDINIIYDSPSAPGKIIDDVTVVITKAIIENKPKFDGRFFAKIKNDGRIQTQITDDSIGVNYVEKVSKMVYVLDDDITLTDRSYQAAIGSGKQTNGIKDLLKGSNLTTDISWTSLAPAWDPDNFNFGGVVRKVNPGARNWNYYIARQSYFGEIVRDPQNVSFGAESFSGQKYGPILPIKYPEATGSSKGDVGVWFIDRSTKNRTVYTSGIDDNALWWSPDRDMRGFSPDSSYTFTHPKDKVGGGIYNGTSYSNVQLAFGGFGSQLYGGVMVCDQSDGCYIDTDNNTLDNFFAIGRDEGSVHYSDPSTVDFVSSLDSGFTFKWKEDPTETVYTIINNITWEHHVRFGRYDHGMLHKFASTTWLAPSAANHKENTLIQAQSSYHKQWRFSVEPSMSGWDPSAPVGEYMTNGLALGVGTFTKTSEVVAAVNPSGNNSNKHLKLTSVENVRLGMEVKHVGGTGSTVYKIGARVVGIDGVNNIVTLTGPSNNPIDSGGRPDPGDTVAFDYTISLVSEHVYDKNGSSISGNNSNTTDPRNNYIIVRGNSTACSNNNTLNPVYGLKPGMMLAEYNINATSTTNNVGIEPVRKNVIIKEIEENGVDSDGIMEYKIHLTGYKFPINFGVDSEFTDKFVANSRVLFKQVSMNGASNFTEINTETSLDIGAQASSVSGSDSFNPTGGIGAVGYTMQIVEPIDEYSDGGNLPPDPFVWETEPKEDEGLDIYYEISENNPIKLDNKSINTTIPVGSKIRSISGEGGTNILGSVTTLTWSSVTGDEIRFVQPLWIGPGVAPNGTTDTYQGLDISGALPLEPGSVLEVTRPNGSIFYVEVNGIEDNITNFTKHISLKTSLYNSEYVLNWYNCFSFGNGVESNRIKDGFNLPFIINGVKVSTTLEQEYKTERRKYGLIYSGIYNSNSGINNLNQFIQAEKITKDINPVYGSIQKLHAGWGQSGDLVTICEDRVLRILANKDALFNADGNTNVTSTNKVLGTATPYSGEFGISKNPESFASESYRAYFADKVRGSIIRLSIDGLTAISDHGMKDWFRDNLKLSNKLIGSYDDKKDEYNITLDNSEDSTPKTVTFKENVRGWVSFKSFIPENGISCANEYYTFKGGKLWKHHYEAALGENEHRNTFYGVNDSSHYSTFTAVLNDLPNVVKSFTTLNYEGSNSKIEENHEDNQYYNLTNKFGWYVTNIHTDLEKGHVNEFIDKEGKWFNYIKGRDIVFNPNTSDIVINNDNTSTFDQASLAIQGLGVISFEESPVSVPGCTDSAANNTNPLATVDDGSCTYPPAVAGCSVPGAFNYNASVSPSNDDGSCIWYYCTDPAALNWVNYSSAASNYNSGSGITDNGSCTYCVYGCTDSTASNYSVSATCDDGSCIAAVSGCMDSSASNYNSAATSDDGSCNWSFCAVPADDSYGTVNGDASFCNTHYPATLITGSGIFDCLSSLITDMIAYNPTAYPDANTIRLSGINLCTSGGCVTSASLAYNSSATWDDGSCTGCANIYSANYLSTVPLGSSTGCETACDFSSCDTYPSAGNYNVTVTQHYSNTSGLSEVKGIFEVEQNAGACFTTSLEDPNTVYDYDYELTGTSVLYNQSSSVGSNNKVTFSNLYAGTYNLTIKSTLPHQLPQSCNISVNVTIDDNTQVAGCTDSTANNYNSAAGYDNGTCTYDAECFICSGINAQNAVVVRHTPFVITTATGGYNDCSFASTGVNYLFNFDTGSGNYGTQTQTDPVTGNSFNTILGQGCSLGCTDSTALNYNANSNNGYFNGVSGSTYECEYCDWSEDINGNTLSSPISLSSTSSPGYISTIASGNGNVTITADNNAPYRDYAYNVGGPGYTYEILTYGDGTLVHTISNATVNTVGYSGLTAGTYQIRITASNGCTMMHPNTFTIVDQITGCTDSNATNYNSAATTRGTVTPQYNVCSQSNSIPSGLGTNYGDTTGHCCYIQDSYSCTTTGFVVRKRTPNRHYLTPTTSDKTAVVSHFSTAPAIVTSTSDVYTLAEAQIEKTNGDFGNITAGGCLPVTSSPSSQSCGCVGGCTSSTACNYNSNATFNDLSCSYGYYHGSSGTSYNCVNNSCVARSGCQYPGTYTGANSLANCQSACGTSGTGTTPGGGNPTPGS